MENCLSQAYDSHVASGNKLRFMHNDIATCSMDELLEAVDAQERAYVRLKSVTESMKTQPTNQYSKLPVQHNRSSWLKRLASLF